MAALVLPGHDSAHLINIGNYTPNAAIPVVSAPTMPIPEPTMTAVAPQPTPTPRQWWTVHWSLWTPQEWQAYYAHQSLVMQQQQAQRHRDTVNVLLAVFLWIPLGLAVVGVIVFAVLVATGGL